jgi:anti-anti-sigma factor
MTTAALVRAAADSRLDGDEVTVRFSDDLLAEGLADVRWLLHDALLAGARRLVVDLTGVQQLSSSAVGSLLSAHRTCRARGGGVVLRGANRRTLDLLRRTGLWRVIRLEAAAADSAASSVLLSPDPDPRRTT